VFEFQNLVEELERRAAIRRDRDFEEVLGNSRHQTPMNFLVVPISVPN